MKMISIGQIVFGLSELQETRGGNDWSINIISNFGWAGSAGRLILFPIELKAPNRGTFRQSKQAPRAMRFL